MTCRGRLFTYPQVTFSPIVKEKHLDGLESVSVLKEENRCTLHVANNRFDESRELAMRRLRFNILIREVDKLLTPLLIRRINDYRYHSAMESLCESLEDLTLD